MKPSIHYNPADVVADLKERGLYERALAIASHHEVTVHEMCSALHEQAVSWARQAMWAELYASGNWNSTRIGRLFRRNHSTILSGVTMHLKRTGPVQLKAEVAA